MVGTAIFRDYLEGKRIVRVSSRFTPQSGQVLTLTVVDDQGKRSRVSIRTTKHREVSCEREVLRQ